MQARLGERRIDIDSTQAVSNIYRAAAAIRRNAEGGILAQTQLSWGGFVILWVLWVFGTMETARLATECDITKGTLTGMVKTLERRGLVKRQRVEADRRRVTVELTPAGAELIEVEFPRFNQFEVVMTDRLTPAEKQELSRLLRIVIANASDD